MQADRSLRSVFVGNIPYDATEEKLRDIFSAVGPVLSFRIVFDRETGKPKGYGFCEYKDQETATSAIRNLNGHDLGGRQLRVDSASNERAEPDSGSGGGSTGQQNSNNENNSNNNNNQTIQQQQHTNIHQLNQLSQPIPEPLVDASTIINNVLCSLQPEQLFDICKQLKSSLLINPNETTQLLMQQPQLSYAILQILAMLKAIDANTTMNALHKQLMHPAQLQPTMPLMAPMATSMPGAPALPQPMAPAPMVMQPFAYMAATGVAAAQQPTLNPASLPQSAAAPGDPRLARQQQQQYVVWQKLI